MKEFLTFKSGKFYFNENYDPSQIESLLVRATVLNETLINLPVLPELASRIEPEIMYGSIASTAAIEGNPITRKDVEKIAQGEEVAIYNKKNQQEIKNLITAYSFLATIKPSAEPFHITEEIIFKLHNMITSDVPDENNRPGKYRNGMVYVGDKAHGGVYTPPKILEDIKNLMREYTGWINSEALLQTNPFIRAALAHYYFATIHPFWDGNGRTARLLEALILQSANIKYAPRELSNYYYRNVDEYYIAFSKSLKLKKNATPFLKSCLTASVESLERIKNTILSFITHCTIKDFYRSERKQKRLTARQFELLDILLESPVSFSLRDLHEQKPFSFLYRSVTTQTARRDIKRLLAQQLIIPDGEKKYVLNIRVLG